MKNILTLLFLFSCLQSIAQSNTVLTINYESTTRDTVIEFPTEDHNKYERILMHYSMRCKDGLVSTGSQRNLGCGEWDYSCNTYLVDSTRVDSLKATSADHVIAGFSGDSYEYRTTPTYTYYQSIQQEVSYNNIITNNVYAVGAPNGSQNAFGQQGGAYKNQFILTAETLTAANLGADDIAGMSFNFTSGDINLKNCRVKMQNTSAASIDEVAVPGAWQELFFYDITLNEDNNWLRFYDNFEWDGTSNILVDLSYDAATGQDLDIQSVDLSYEGSRSAGEDMYMSVASSGHVYVDDGFDNIGEEITISFWQYGASNQPTNSTIFEGRDANNLRQANVHLPWSNGQVYWDCGNDGGGYDRINKQANPEDFKDQWNHWAFTKNATTGEMHIYLNGILWHSGTGLYRSMDISDMNIGAAIRSSSLFYYGAIDAFRVWNKALDENTIRAYMSKPVDDTHPNYNSLILNYNFNEVNGDNAYIDSSPNENHGSIVGQVGMRAWKGENIAVDLQNGNTIPDLNLHQGLYFTWVEDNVVVDSIQNLSQKVDFYSVEGTDLVLDSTAYYYSAGDYPILDEMGDQVGTVNFAAEGTIDISELSYYSKSPMAYELMSFVTPYGIGIDFGLDGHTWTFDVTEFGPILKGNKRLYLSRGGQWQEEMDIRFEFIEGTPDRNVIDIKQVWPVNQTAFGSITNDWRLEPRTFTYDPSIAQYEIKTVVTGHGQEGEFIPRNHTINIGAFAETWQAWTECASNPIYPQGGTWVYDRAGWCPGAPSDVQIIDATQYFQFLGDVELDYGVDFASGDSRYIVNVQLIEYGAPNKANDASISDVIYPSSRIEHARFNPTCQPPLVILENKGSEVLTSATIEYGILGKSSYSYNWTGNLNFLSKEEVELDYLFDLLSIEEGDQFFATIKNINGGSDAYSNNDMAVTDLSPVKHYSQDIVIEFRTNNRPTETSYTLRDNAGNIIHGRSNAAVSAFTLYRDTIRNLNGCFQLLVEDSDDDGLSWWANSDGSGYVRIRSVGDNYDEIATDFGKFVEYNFSAGMISDVEDVELVQDLSIYPNPGTDQIRIDGIQDWNESIFVQLIDANAKVILAQNYKSWQLSGEGISQLQSLPTGMYWLQLNDGERVQRLKWVKVD
ncbi:MAG: T9SS type A sorting domain-containing protein [Saprospiraceae bacterium]|nr:T9SS type A sorting domain-containing protein [Saprospiraceae bacterium]